MSHGDGHMKCTFTELPPPTLTCEEWMEVDKINIKLVTAIRESLSASKGFIETCPNPTPCDGLKIGMPLRWGHEFYPADILPHDDYMSFETGSRCTNL